MPMDPHNGYIPGTGSEEPTFTSNGGADPPDFRMIPWGDIDLQRELLVNKESGVVGYRHENNFARRVYCAQVDGRASDMTVAVYQGDGADKDWHQDIETYIHPNIIQIYAGASYGNIHATIFHGDLVPFKQYVSTFSPIVAVYLYALFAKDYLRSELQWDVDPWFCTFWIRSSTGRISADLVPPDRDNKLDLDTRIPVDPLRPTPFDPSNYEAMAIQSLSLRDYHTICSLHSHFTSISTTASESVTLGAIICWPMLDRAHYQDVVEIASLPEPLLHCPGWLLLLFEDLGAGDLMENGWIRFNANDSYNKEIVLIVDTRRTPTCWLLQANYVFSSLHIESNLEDYVLLLEVEFKVTVSHPSGNCPQGYLFLCPKQDFQVPSTMFRWPACPAYWSLDASGDERLSTEEATQLGFPLLELATQLEGVSWDTSVYAGLRQFHRAKGFDPERQDVARHLGDRLFCLSRNVNPRVEEYEQEDSQHTQQVSHEDRVDGETVGVEPKRSPIQSPEDTDSDSEQALHPTDEDITATLKILMNIQLALMLFIATCWMYDNLQ
ncbi:hypothetical protein C8R46DRAFT_1228126 [Mycena filopes]|nr:hypothetical protein C8R46DRAFT_1228126 [Mycena filopes]